ncbi:MAG: C69 family dipeptidase [bacterium]
MRLSIVFPLTCMAALMLFTCPTTACTNLMVTSGASSDGSVMVTYTCDGEFHPILRHQPASDHEPDSMLEIRHWDGKLMGEIKQVPHTYAVVNLMNEHQVVIGETTFDGRLELQNPDGVLHYWWLMRLALQRARTAREAVTVMTELVTEYGYASTGESFSIGDPEEIWYLEMIGPGPGGRGAHWVALRVPDGYVCAHANTARIGEFPLDDPESCLYSDEVISFATERGFYDPATGQPFSFRKAYCPVSPQTLRYTATRVWSLFRRCAPSLELTPDHHRAVPGSAPYPLWIKPDRKLSVADVFSLMRDHYEGTPYDMAQGVDAGPYGTPNRWRPMTWELDDVKYSWERPISTQQTGFSFVSQSRDWLPDPIGGLLWYGVDDTYTTCYIPLYCGISDVPPAYARGSLSQFTWDSAWWVFNFVANYANLKYSYMIADIREVQSDLEGAALALQPEVERAAVAMAQNDPELLALYLTDYSGGRAARTVERWTELGEFLLTKYNDGYVKDDAGRPQEHGYPEVWLRAVTQQRPDIFKLKEWGADTLRTELPY